MDHKIGPSSAGHNDKNDIQHFLDIYSKPIKSCMTWDWKTWQWQHAAHWENQNRMNAAIWMEVLLTAPLCSSLHRLWPHFLQSKNYSNALMPIESISNCLKNSDLISHFLCTIYLIVRDSLTNKITWITSKTQIDPNSERLE